MAERLGKHDVVTIPRDYAVRVLILICLFTFSYGMSWALLVGDAERDLPRGRQVGGATRYHIHRARCLLLADADVRPLALHREVWDIPVLRGLARAHDRSFVAAFVRETKGDRCATGDQAVVVGRTLVLEKVRR